MVGRLGGLCGRDRGRWEADGPDAVKQPHCGGVGRGDVVVGERRPEPRFAQVLRPRAGDVVDGLQELEAVARRHKGREGLSKGGEVALQEHAILLVDWAEPSTSSKEPAARGPATGLSSERDSPPKILRKVDFF